MHDGPTFTDLSVSIAITKWSSLMYEYDMTDECIYIESCCGPRKTSFNFQGIKMNILRRFRSRD